MRERRRERAVIYELYVRGIGVLFYSRLFCVQTLLGYGRKKKEIKFDLTRALCDVFS